MKPRSVIALTLFALLMACGGGSGGGGGGSSATPQTLQPIEPIKPIEPIAVQIPEGMWQGSSSVWNGSSFTNYSIVAMVLEDGEFYNIFSRNNIVYGIDYGTTTGYSTTVTSKVTEFYIPSDSVYPATLLATFVPQSTMNGTVSYSGSSLATFSTTYNSSYDTPATLSAITGTYTGNYYSGTVITLSILSDGVVSGSSAGNLCIISGNVSPRPSGKNVYNLSLTFTGTCTPGPGAGPAAGIAFLNTSSGNTHLYTAGLNPDKTNGFFWIGTKQ